MVRANTTTGFKAETMRLCPPKGESNEPLWFLRTFVDPPIVFEPGDQLFNEQWELQDVVLGTEQWNEPWEANTFVVGPSFFVEPWEATLFTPGTEQFLEQWEATLFQEGPLQFNEPWEASLFIPGTLQFLEEWEFAAPHNWFISEELVFGSGGGGA